MSHRHKSGEAVTPATPRVSLETPAEWKKPDPEGHGLRDSAYVTSRTGTSTETESRSVVAPSGVGGGGEGGMGPDC